MKRPPRGNNRLPQRLLLFVLVASLVTPLLGQAQQHGVGIRASFAGAPAGLTYLWQPKPSMGVEVVLGHTRLIAKGSDLGLFQRGHTIVGGAFQPRWVIGDDVPAGFYGIGGLRLRFHNQEIARNKEFRQTRPDAPLPNNKRPSLSPDIVLGGGVFVQVAELIEFYGEVEGVAGNLQGQGWGFGVGTSVGVRLLFGS